MQVNCDRVAPQLLSISTSSPLSPIFSSFLLRSLQYVCVCFARSMQRRKIEGGGRVAYNRLPGDSIEHNEFPEAFILQFIVEYVALYSLRICFYHAT